MSTPDELIAELRGRLIDARLDLADAIRAACPGRHTYVQHRDGLPPWCKACRYTEDGYRIDTEGAVA